MLPRLGLIMFYILESVCRYGSKFCTVNYLCVEYTFRRKALTEILCKRLSKTDALQIRARDLIND